MKRKNHFNHGIIGGFLTIAIFIIILISVFRLFNYRISIDKVVINSTNISDTVKLNNTSDYKKYKELKQILINDLNKDKLILTPQEYTNNVVNYYNSILLILSVIIASFSILSFIYFRNHTKDQIQDLMQSDDFRDDVANKLVGKAEGRFNEYIEEIELKNSELIDKIIKLENKIIDLEKNITTIKEKKENGNGVDDFVDI